MSAQGSTELEQQKAAFLACIHADSLDGIKYCWADRQRVMEVGKMMCIMCGHKEARAGEMLKGRGFCTSNVAPFCDACYEEKGDWPLYQLVHRHKNKHFLKKMMGEGDA